jgi:hypothetical protein
MATLHLTELPIEDVLALVARAFDRTFAAEQEQLDVELTRDCVDRDTIDATLKDQQAEFMAWRRGQLAELCDRFFMPSGVLH